MARPADRFARPCCPRKMARPTDRFARPCCATQNRPARGWVRPAMLRTQNRPARGWVRPAMLRHAKSPGSRMGSFRSPRYVVDGRHTVCQGWSGSSDRLARRTISTTSRQRARATRIVARNEGGSALFFRPEGARQNSPGQRPGGSWRTAEGRCGLSRASALVVTRRASPEPSIAALTDPVSPFQGEVVACGDRFPGRCPGLSCSAPLGRRGDPEADKGLRLLRRKLRARGGSLLAISPPPAGTPTVLTQRATPFRGDRTPGI